MSSRIKEKLRSGEMAVSGDQWPIFLYQGYAYDPDDPWNGLFRSALLVSVSFILINLRLDRNHFPGIQTHIHFSELCGKGAQSDKVRQCTYSWDDTCHARFHCLYCYPGRLFYCCFNDLFLGFYLRQVRFALSSSPVCSRTDTITDSERFYNTVLDLFEDVEEREEVNDLLNWWNR